MINFRYHVVSIVAVFLALAVGIVMGTTVISESVVGRLQADAREFRARNGELRQEADRLEQELSYYDRFGEAIVPPAISGRLAGRSAVLVIEDAAPGTLIDRTTDALRAAGASTPARIRLTAAWSLPDAGARENLAAALGGDADASDGPALMTRAGEALGRRLTSSADAGAEADLLRALDRGGFVKLEDLPEVSFPAANALIVYLAGGTPTPVPDHQTFAIPLLRMLAGERTNARVAVAEPLDADASLVDGVRGVAELARAIATIDHATTWPGALALVWALAATAREPAAHYGVRRGASAIAPSIIPAGSPGAEQAP
ncbi:MAG TPA: copper transporter [Actinomycetota bacterium]